MGDRNISSRCHELDLRAEHIYHLGSMLIDCSMPSGLEDFIEDEPELLIEFFGISEDDQGDPELVSELLRDGEFGGFLVCFATPVRKYTSESSYRSSWGYYQTTWLYGDDFAALFDKAEEWVLRLDSEWRAKAAQQEVA